MLILCILLLTACASGVKQVGTPLKVVSFVDLKRYMGTWYEIARYPHRFQEGCVDSSATYSLRDDGKVDVLNQCYKGKLDGELVKAHGKAWVLDPATNAKLKVSFFWPFSGHYWIIDLGENYEYAVVGHPDRNYLWILSRTPEMDDQLYNDIIEKLKMQSYDTSKLIRTLQTIKTK
ncbi:MAG TPA: lipocalin family protein [Thermodesulfovibrionales bacterium]|nr:lipocalin family protein [Thermodesulfovibrionales bacterium]